MPLSSFVHLRCGGAGQPEMSTAMTLLQWTPFQWDMFQSVVAAVIVGGLVVAAVVWVFKQLVNH